MNTKNIENVFAEYLNTPNTQYAILLNGTWGSGKTYFWKYNLQTLAEKKEFKTIYLSLNGLSKIETLEYQLFLKLLPFIGKTENKFAKSAISLVSNVANQAAKTFLKISIAEAFKDIHVDNLDFSKHIICFDDLERCQIPIKEILGFINNYVEHKFLKTIILCDEKKIEDSLGADLKSYHDIKEKVIGRVLNYEPDLKIILPLFFENYKKTNDEFYKFLGNQKVDILSILLEYRESNLRIISFYIQVLEKLFQALKDIKQNYVSEVILFSAIISIEFKRGQLKSSDYSNPMDIQNIDEHFYSLNIAKTSKFTEEEKEKRVKTYAEIFYNKYLNNRIKQYYFYSSIYTYILTGYLNYKEFEDELKLREPSIPTADTLSFRKLLDYKFRELSNCEFEVLCKQVLDFAKAGKYSIYDYAQIANFYIFFSNNSLIKLSVEEITLSLKEGLNIAKERKQINDFALQNLLHFKSDEAKAEEIKSLIKKIHSDIKKEQYAKESDEFIASLSKDEFTLTEIFTKHQVSKELFQYIDIARLFKAIVIATNKQVFNFTELLKYRYQSVNIGEFLFGDYKSLKELKTKLEDYLKTNSQEKLNHYLLNTLIADLEKICNHLLATKRQLL